MDKENILYYQSNIKTSRDEDSVYAMKYASQQMLIDKAIELLGNYRHYSMPDEKQNSANEDLVNNAFGILKEVE